MAMADKILNAGREKLLRVTFAAYELLSVLIKIPRGTKFEMCHADFNELGSALTEVANSEPAPLSRIWTDLPKPVQLALETLASAWGEISTNEDSILHIAMRYGEFELRVAIAREAIPEDVRRMLQAGWN